MSSSTRDVPTALGGLVQSRRRALGLSLRDAAGQAGISASYLLAIEHGRNPTTGRAPTPSPPVLAALGRLLGIAPSALLEIASTPPAASSHGLIYQTGRRHRSPFNAARQLFGDRVGEWVEITDPRLSASRSRNQSVVIRTAGPLGPVSSTHYDAKTALAALESILTDGRELVPGCLGLIFGANSTTLSRVDNPRCVVVGEATWERDVAEVCQRALGIKPAANLCVYRERDLLGLRDELNPLDTALTLVRTHPRVAIESEGGAVTTGPAAIERILAAARPPATSDDAWSQLSSAAALGLTHSVGGFSGPALR